MIETINVKYEYTDSINVAEKFLNNLKTNIIACDFETASIYTEEDIENAKKMLDPKNPSYQTLNYLEKIKYEIIINADGLYHQSIVVPTHLSIAWSNKDSYVIILPDKDIRQMVCDFLVITDIKQIWHNAAYDFQFIKYYTNKFPKNFDDTMLMVKSLTNHVETFKYPTGLKKLQGHIYGDWAVSKDDFKLSEMYQTYMLKYSATDSCATFNLYLNILEDKKQYINKESEYGNN